MYAGVPTIAPASAKLMSVSFSSVALATPKSITFGVGRPSTSVTSTLPGFRSRWMIPFWWACCTAWHTATNSSSRASTDSRCASQYSVSGTPLHQLHDEERLAGRGDAAVVDAGDVRVVHQRQRLPLGVEPGQHRPSSPSPS